jgi:hypothetical protein
MKKVKDKVAWIVGLCVACPHGQELAECPVQHIRGKLLKERIDMVHDLAEEMIVSHLRHHSNCSALRSMDYHQPHPELHSFVAAHH